MADESSSPGDSGGTAKRVRGRPFTGADDPRLRQNMEDSPPLPEPEHEVGDGAPQALKDLRWAYRNIGLLCRGSPSQEAFREAAKADPVKYVRDLMRLEGEWRSARAAEQAAAVGGEGEAGDAGEERLREVAARLIREAGGSQGL